VCLSVLRADLKLYQVRELLFAVASDKDLNLILVFTLPERQGRLASDVPAPEKELRERLLRIE
jgi:hypothetical protein